jgi:hypothetical protein
VIANGPVSTFIPIIINSLGFSELNSLLLVMPAGAIIGTVEWVAPYLCYKFKGVRTYVIVVCQMGTILAALLLWQLPQSVLGGQLYACFTLATFGGSYAVLMGLQTANTAGYVSICTSPFCNRILLTCSGLCADQEVCCCVLDLLGLLSRQFRWPATVQRGRCASTFSVTSSTYYITT